MSTRLAQGGRRIDRRKRLEFRFNGKRLSGFAGDRSLTKLAPVDLHPDSFAPGEMRRSRVAQAAAAFWMTGPDSFTLIAFRSLADYVFDLLSTAAAPGGKVGLFSAE